MLAVKSQAQNGEYRADFTHSIHFFETFSALSPNESKQISFSSQNMLGVHWGVQQNFWGGMELSE